VALPFAGARDGARWHRICSGNPGGSPAAPPSGRGAKPEEETIKPRLSFGNTILVGLVLGVGTGLFLGERAAPLRLIADGFVRLLQMTVLPYVTVSLVVGIGSLDPSTARRLFLRVGALTVALWCLALGAVFLMPIVFPPLESASFFSTTLVETPPTVDFLALYIPSNPFHSLANSIVPAVVLFSVLTGVALMGVERKQGLIESLLAVERALARANRLVVRLTPIGLFAIAAHTAGTMDLDQVARLRVFQIAYAAMALLLALWVLPGLVGCLTPVPAWRVLRSTRDVLITAFITGDLFIVLPSLIDCSKHLIEESGGLETEGGSAPDVIVPAFYNFPHSAKLLSLSFVLFAAWYSETTLTLAEYPGLGAAGIVSFFGSMNVAMPFLLDFARIPADTFQLFLATGVINSRFGTLAGASHMLVLAIVGTYALHGRLRLSWPRVLRYAASTALLTAALLGGMAVGFRALGGGSYEGARIAGELGLLLPACPGATMLDELPGESLSAAHDERTLLDAVRERGKIRIGFVATQPPYSHFNSRGELVGFDVEMGHQLARDLGIRAEFAPVPRERLLEVVESDRVDVVMAGVAVTTRRASRAVFSGPYLDETLAFVVPDFRRADFSDATWVRAQDGLQLGVPDLPNLEALVRREFPKARTVPIPLAETKDPLAEGLRSADALVLTAERGSFLTLLHPAFSVAVPHPLEIRLPLAYPVARHDVEAARFLSTWIDLKRKDGTIQALYDHWILGKDAKARQPRWSILRNVLGWER
jgi:Na+/H+-dicarboxylate symporter/ABC-type amino acid transport substrate-binding protein